MQRETIEVAGLKRQAEIAVDRWGIPHIRAGRPGRCLFVQGFNAARIVSGRSTFGARRASAFSPRISAGIFAQDYASRLFYRGDMQREWAAYGARFTADLHVLCVGRECIHRSHRPGTRATAAGIRARARYGPAKWRAADIVRIRSHAVAQNALSNRAFQRAGGADAATDLLRKGAAAPAMPEKRRRGRRGVAIGRRTLSTGDRASDLHAGAARGDDAGGVGLERLR